MPNSVESLRIRDSVDQIAAFGTLALVPERGGSGSRYQLLDASTDAADRDALPIVNQSLVPKLYFNNTLIGNLVTGDGKCYVTHADGRFSSDESTYNLTITSEDAYAPHRRRVTALFPSPDRHGSIKTLHDALNHVASVAGTSVNLVGLPDYKLFGTAEFINDTLLAAMISGAQPMNQFDFYKIYPRFQFGTLAYLVVNYTKVPRNPYAIPNVKEVTRTYTRYTQGTLIGDQDIIVSGGDRALLPSELAHLTPTARFQEVSYTEVQRYTSQVGEQTIAQYENWVEVETTTRIDVQLRRDTAGTWVLPTSLTHAVEELKTGTIDDIRIVKTVPLQRIERQYSTYEGLISESKTTMQYTTAIFNNGIYRDGQRVGLDCEDIAGLFESREIQTGETTTNYIFPTGERLPTTQTRREYIWNSVGAVESTVSSSYTFFRDSWVRTDISQQVTDPLDLVNATIQFWSKFRSESKGISKSPPLKRPLPTLERWRLKNGELVTETFFRAEDCTQFDATDLLLSGFEIEVPMAQQAGLKIVSDLAVRQKAIEQARGYWETLTVTSTIDLNVYVGMPASAEGKYGYVDSVEHTITQDEGTTTTTLRFLHV